MALFVIGDLHLSLGCDKPMDIFSGWQGHMEKLGDNWKKNIKPDDTVIIAGDVSWGMNLNESAEDFKFINNLPGKKYIIKGNHDYWWTTRLKMESFFENNRLNSLHIINNNSVIAENIAICGTRGWLFENGQDQDRKIISRESARLEASLASVGDFQGEKIVILHYPPVYGDQVIPEFLDIMKNHGVRRCFYGHIHGKGIQFAYNGNFFGIEFMLCSADAIEFNPYKICTG